MFEWFCLVKGKGFSTFKAFSLGIVCGLGGLSLILQIEFLIGLPDYAWVLEILAFTIIVWINQGNWKLLNLIPRKLIKSWQKAPLEVSVLGVALTYLLLQVVLLPPSSWDAMTYHLPRVLLWEQNHSLLIRDYSLYLQAVFPVGSDILYHLFLRLRTDYGLGLFSWLFYIVILLGTYELARSKVDRTLAFTSALVIASLPHFVYVSTAIKNDIIIAAVAVACILWMDTWLSTLSIESFLGLGLTLAFGISAKITFLLFIVPFLILFFYLTIKKVKLKPFLRLLADNRKAILLASFPVLIMSQCWLFLDNYHQYGGWFGPDELSYNNQNNDGLAGTAANLIRYSVF